ncbi:hypothetical protein EZS27_020254, partial [termite gut metagenome]
NLYQQGKKWLADYLGNRDIFTEHTREQEEKQVTEALLSHIENSLLNGTQLILNQVFKLVGFDKISDDVWVVFLFQKFYIDMVHQSRIGNDNKIFQIKLLDKVFNNRQHRMSLIFVALVNGIGQRIATKTDQQT